MMKNMGVAALLIVTVAGAAACSGGSEREAQASAGSGPPPSLLELERERQAALEKTLLEADRRQHDFGRVPIYGGDVETAFQVSNGGPDPVRLVSVYTSCGCTTAVLEFDDGSREGPFGMPGHELPTRLHRPLRPGEAVRVRVIFDPAAHGPAGLGPVTRAVSLHTGDGGGVELVIAAEVVQA